MKTSLSKAIDKEVIERSQQNDPVAFEQIVLFYEKRVYRFCRRYIPTREDAEDVTQEIFLKVFRNIKKYDPRASSFSTWIFTISKNSIYDWLRSKRRHKEIKISDLENLESTLAYRPDIQIHKKLDIKIALSKIRPEYKKVIQLFYWKGFGYKEIAKIMKIPLNTVKTYVSRAKKSLASHFKKNGNGKRPIKK